MTWSTSALMPLSCPFWQYLCLKDLKPWPWEKKISPTLAYIYSLYWLVFWQTWRFSRPTSHLPLWCLPLSQMSVRKGGRGREGGLEMECWVDWERARNPQPLKLWRGFGGGGGGFNELGPQFMLAVWRQRKSQNCSSLVSMATILGPTQVLVEVFCFSRGSD